MPLKEIYTEFNDTYYYYLNFFIKKALETSEERRLSFFKECEEKGVDFTRVLYKKNIDDYEEILIGQDKFFLLPMGLKNSLIHYNLISNKTPNNPRITMNSFRDLLLNSPKFIPYYYPQDASVPKKANLKKVCFSYITHYKKALDEEWSEDDFYKMFFELEYLSVKYAMNKETKEIFAIGFFGFSVRNGAGGQSLTNGELYIMPEFRKLGISKKLIGLTFEQAKNNGIENFDSITYRTPKNDALAFWEEMGANKTDLFHIEGDIQKILKKISSESKKKEKKHL